MTCVSGLSNSRHYWRLAFDEVPSIRLNGERLRNVVEADDVVGYVVREQGRCHLRTSVRDEDRFWPGRDHPMSSTRHKWGERDEKSPQRTLYPCSRCGMLKVSRHEFEGGREQHWKEFFMGTDRVDAGDGKTPACDGRLEDGAET